MFIITLYTIINDNDVDQVNKLCSIIIITLFVCLFFIILFVSIFSPDKFNRTVKYIIFI